MRIRSVIAVALAGVFAGGVEAVASSAGTLSAGSHQQLIDRVLARVAPGDHGRILRGFELKITLPPGADDPRRADDTQAWRAGLAAQELALHLPRLRGWTSPEIGTESFDQIRDPPGISHLDALSLVAARRQLSANLAVLSAGIPATADLRMHTSVVPLALEHRRFAFDVSITVDNLDVLHHYYGDLALGPGTGLTGRDEPIEGMAVYVHDRHGHNLGAWSDTRAEGGAVDYGPGDGCLEITLAFRDRRGNPPPGACHG